MKQCNRFVFLSFCSVIIAFTQSVIAQTAGSYTEWMSVATQVNWSNSTIRAEGYGVAPENRRKEVGSLLACRAAITDAQRNLIEATKGVRVSSETSVSALAANYDTVKTAVDGMVRGAAIETRELSSDGKSCKVSLLAFIKGNLSEQVYSKVLTPNSASINTLLSDFSLFLTSVFNDLSFFSKAYAQSSPVETIASGNAVVSFQEFEQLDQRVKKLETSLEFGSPALLEAKTETQPTGLILDVRGYEFIPTMTPSLLAGDKSLIYPSEKDAKSLISSGKLLSLFSRSLEFALNHPIVGDRPLLIKATTDREQATNILLNQQNSSTLMALAQDDFFAEPKIIIVLD